MDWLNYHHLHYFWRVAREGGLVPASSRLRLSPSTVSEQVRSLERALGEQLFTKSGRRLVLTDMGRVALRYADEIFALGRELQDALKGRATGRSPRLLVGIADVVPKVVARRLLEPALELPDSVQLVCLENKPERLFADLAAHDLDVVITDGPVPPSIPIRAFSHLLGECGIDFLASPDLARTHAKRFPDSLSGAPVLLPTQGTTLRRSLDEWFAKRGIRPRVVGEFDDSALLTAFGEAGRGVFPIPSAITREVSRQHGVRTVGRAADVRERYYAITVERRIEQPAVVAISREGRASLFG